MKFRTFLYILIALAVVTAMSSLFVSNRRVLDQQVQFWGGIQFSVGLTLLFFLLLGAVITALAGFTREVSLTLERRRQRRATKKSEEIEEDYTKGLVEVLEGREDEAMRHFRAVLERDSRHFNTLLKIGEILRNQEKYAEAIEYHRKAHHLKEDDTRPLYALVDDHEAKGDMDRARAVLGKIIAINKHSVAAWRKLRSLHMKERNWAKALEAHQRALKYSTPTDPGDRRDLDIGRGIRYEIAVDRLRAGRAREAIAGLRRILREDAHFIPAHVKLGEALVRETQERQAVESWHKGFEVTGSPVLLTVLENHFLKREQPLAAIEALKRCIARTRRDTLAKFYLGKLYFRLEMLDDAASVLSALEGRASYAPTLHHLLGRIHERRGNPKEAAAEYRKVIKEMDLIQLEYRCQGCGDTVVEWTDRCTACGRWSTVAVNFREEVPLEDLGLSAAPVYTSRS